MMKSLIIALSCSLALCNATECDAQVTVNSAWMRATPPGQNVGGAYLKITSATTAYLVGGSSPAAKAVELHESVLENNIMKMHPVPRLELPAGKTVELKPGGYHLMLLDLKRPLVKGDSVTLTLIVEEAGKRQSVDVKAEVAEIAAMRPRHDGK